jgi:chromosomal replication initiator protein
MSLTADEAWSRLLACAKREVPEQTFRGWLEPLKPLEFTGSVLALGAPDQFAADWNESKHSELLSGLAPIAFGHPCVIEFRVDERITTRVQMDLFTRPSPSEARTMHSRVVSRPLLAARYTFEHFVVGKSNELAAAAAMAAAESPGRVYNPLFIYGATGLGKTHLMQAVAHDILTRAAATRIIYVGAEQFTNDYVASIQARNTQDFRRRYRETDLLLVDDVHFLKGKEATQEEFFHTFNALYEAGRQIVVTSDRSPSDIPGIESRLVSRFQWGMVADIEPPDLEHRIAILQKKAEIDQLQRSIPDDVLRFLAENIRSSVRELEGAIVRLLAYASLRHRDITMSLAAEALRGNLTDHRDTQSIDLNTRLTPAAIQATVSQVWSVTVEALQSQTRTKTLTIPRQAAMFLCRELLKLQLTEIGAAFGGRDHSTVIHSLERATILQESDPEFRTKLSTARSLLLRT